ncbi:MAG: tRNA lysidine(34) synthetase TilS [Verrucomicrobiales bacterium]
MNPWTLEAMPEKDVTMAAGGGKCLRTVGEALSAAGLIPGQKLLVGVSGGCDSVVLLDILRSLGYGVLVAHVNHRLRGNESETDAEFVCWLAGTDECHIMRRDVAAHARKSGVSIETAGRDVRRACFARIARATGIHHLALAHHADDQAETMLWNLARGCGLGGLAGMAPAEKQSFSRGCELVVLRPLLSLRRNELVAYARARGLVWREDASNLEREFTRNRLRHDVLPVLAEASGRDPVPAMARLASIVSDEDEFLDRFAAEALAKLVVEKHCLEVAGLRALPVAIARRVLLLWLGSIAASAPSFREIEAALAMVRSSGPPSRVNLTSGCHLARRQKRLWFERGK